MSYPLSPWPYAAESVNQFEFLGNRIAIWVVFGHPMDTDVVPAANLFSFRVDGVEKTPVGLNWFSEFTLNMQVLNIPAHPDRVLSTYTGPNNNLRTTWGKQWEPWKWLHVQDVPYGWEHILDVNVDNALVTINGTLLLTSKTVLTGTYNDLDVAGVNIVYLNALLGNIVINGFSNGVLNQVLYLAILIHGGNNITVAHESGAADELIRLHAGVDETLSNEYGGWNLIHSSRDWLDISHAKHV